MCFITHIKLDVMIIHCWDYCWKCEFDTDVKKEKIFCHHNGEQWRFYKKSTSQNTQQKVGYFSNLYIARNKEF